MVGLSLLLLMMFVLWFITEWEESILHGAPSAIGCSHSAALELIHTESCQPKALSYGWFKGKVSIPTPSPRRKRKAGFNILVSSSEAFSAQNEVI